MSKNNNNNNNNANNNNKKKKEKVEENDKMQKVKSDFTTLVDTVEKRIKELEEKETHWAMLEASMEEHASKAADKITLDIGGQKFATSKTTLTSHKGSFFDAMLSSGKWKPDSKGRYFIDRNPELFPVILDYLRTGKVALKRYAYDVTEDLKTELDFYLIDIPELFSIHSKLLDKQQEEKLKTWIGKNTFTLLYSGLRDGFRANVFHAKCDNQGPTVTIVKSTNGYLFGGYTSTNWDSSGQYRSAQGSFLFGFTNPYGISPIIFPGTGSNSIYCNSSYGPTFGDGHDLHIADNCNMNSNSYSSFPSSYQDNSGYGYGGATFTGSSNFQVSEVEVFLVK